MMERCVFCQIINREIAAEIIYEDKEILVFKNIRPEAPIHFLLVPKKHIEWKDGFRAKDSFLFGKLILTAKEIVVDKDIFQAAKLIFNIGKTGHIPHIHLHLLGGWKKKIPTYNI